MNERTERIDLPLAGLCLGTAAVLLAVCSWSSPLYPYHCGGDANVYFTIGRNMLDGLVPYRDLIDQKGPLLFFIQMLAALVSRQSFLGVWLSNGPNRACNSETISVKRTILFCV